MERKKRETRSGRQTREWILTTARQLFNSHGTAAVSTKRIASEMGISPGNLHYHFRNKDEIIRAIMEQKLKQFDINLQDPTQPPLQQLLVTIRGTMLTWQEYPFLKREMVTLIKGDPQLKTQYQESKALFFEQAHRLISQMIQDGILTLAKDDQQIESLLTISWIIGEHWLNHLTLDDRQSSEDNMRQGLDLIKQVWNPYFSPATKAAMVAI